MSKIDIIIPVFNDRDNLENVLVNLMRQTIKDDLSICIVDDKSDVDYKDIISIYSNDLDIKYFKLDENVGSGLARQYGFDHTSNDYIFYLDADDYIMYKDSLEKISVYMQYGFEMICGNTFYEKDDIYCLKDGDLHGKLYKRSFLIKNKIRFNETRFHEDNAYNNIVLINNSTFKFVNETVYYYRNNVNSITSVDKELEFNRMEIFVHNMDYVLKETIGIDNYNKDMFLYSKTKYLGNIYRKSNDQKKEIIISWMKKYGLDELIKYFDYEDAIELKNIMVTHNPL